MVKFLTTIELSYEILQIIKTADREIILVTPYIKLSPNLKDSLAEANRKGKEITLIYGKSGLSKEEKAFLDNLDNLSIYFHENLHAKCYFNEFSMLITSMNLYEFSEKQNKEFGVFIKKEVDKDGIYQDGIYEDVIEEVLAIIQSANHEKKNKSNTFKSFIREKSKEELFCNYLNNYFHEKHFRLEKLDEDFGRIKVIVSENFLTNVDIEIGSNINFIFNLNNSTCEKLFNNNKILTNSEIKNEYRIYWNPPYDIIKVYHSIPMKEKWDILDQETKYKYFKRAIELVTREIEKEIIKITNS